MSSELAPGVVVAGFEIEALLGRGAMAEVYRARDLEGDRVVALKLLEPVAGTDERFRSRFLRESQLAAAIEHPQIVRTLASGEADGRLYLAMELIDGSDLRQLLREQGRLQPEHAVQIVSQIADALDAAHQAGLVHRDVKPGNILLDTDGNAYVCDFGLARHVSSVSSLTGDRGFVGTIDYVPPEQIEGTPIDKRADIYSLGCVLYECLTGTRPYDRDSELAVVFAHLNEPPPHPTDTNPDLPTAFDTVIETALAKNPDHRYPTTTNLATAAQAALTGQILKRKQPRNRRLAAAGTIAVLLAAAAATATVLLTRTTHHPLPVTITEAGIGPAKLGDSNLTLTRLWNGGQKLSTQFPPDYALLRNSSLDVSAYFSGTVDRAVELITWNANDRTDAGVGPCSTLAELKRVYGKRLKLVPNNHGYGYTVGKHLFFAIGTPPTPRFVSSIAVYSDRLASAGFNALSEGPCTGSAAATIAAPPATTTIQSAAPRLTQTLTAKRFSPRVTVRAPAGWTQTADGHVFILASKAPSNAQDQIVFMLDPYASTGSGPTRPGGTVLTNVSRTPTGLVSWFRRNPYLVVTTPGTVRFGTPVLTARTIDVDLSPRAPKEDPACPKPCISYLAFRGPGYRFPFGTGLGEPARLYFALVRTGTVTHTLVIAIDSPSRQTFRQVLPTATAIVKSLRIDAVPVEELSVFGSQCSKVFGGTCLGEMTAGRHSTSTFQPTLSYVVPVGWTNYADHPAEVAFVPPGGDWEQQALNNNQSDYIDVLPNIAPPQGRCGGAPSQRITPTAYVRSLRRDPALLVSRPQAIAMSGLSGVAVDVRMRVAWTKPCPWSSGAPAALVVTGVPPVSRDVSHNVVPPPMVMRLYLLRYKGGTLGIEVDALQGPARLAGYDKVVRSFRFDGR